MKTKRLIVAGVFFGAAIVLGAMAAKENTKRNQQEEANQDVLVKMAVFYDEVDGDMPDVEFLKEDVPNTAAQNYGLGAIACGFVVLGLVGWRIAKP